MIVHVFSIINSLVKLQFSKWFHVFQYQKGTIIKRTFYGQIHASVYSQQVSMKYIYSDICHIKYSHAFLHILTTLLSGLVAGTMALHD